MEKLITAQMDQAAFLVYRGATAKFLWSGGHCTFVLEGDSLSSLLDSFMSEGHNVNAKAFIYSYRQLAEQMKKSKPA